METGKPVILVCAAGSAINTEVEPDALLHVWYPGAEGGTALANILFGDVSFRKAAGYLLCTRRGSACFHRLFHAEPHLSVCHGQCALPLRIWADLFRDRLHRCDLCKRNRNRHGKNRGNRDTEDVLELYLKDYSEQAVKIPVFADSSALHCVQEKPAPFPLPFRKQLLQQSMQPATESVSATASPCLPEPINQIHAAMHFAAIVVPIQNLHFKP